MKIIKTLKEKKNPFIKLELRMINFQILDCEHLPPFDWMNSSHEFESMRGETLIFSSTLTFASNIVIN